MTAALEDAYAKSLDCVHCGLCVTACPTYELLSSEVDSPRGRIHLMRAVAEGRLDPGLPELHPPIQRCLGCRACESACPSGVRYGSMLESMRELLAEKRGLGGRVLGRLLEHGLGRQATHRRLVGVLRLLQRSGLLALLGKLPLPSMLRSGLELLPRIPGAADRAAIGPGVYEPIGELRAEVGLFTGCLMETLFGRVNRALLFVLRRNGCRVHVPRDQACCGALLLHGGFRREAIRLVDENVAAFGTELDAIVVDAAGCGAAMKEYGAWHPGAEAFSATVRDMSEWLVELGTLPFDRELASRVVYDDPCHLRHGQGISRQPRELLRAVPGLELLEVPDPGSCCGSAGIYNLTQPGLADSILERKMDALLASNPDRIITGNPGCMLQIAMGLRRRRRRVPVQHLAELLSEAYGRPVPVVLP